MEFKYYDFRGNLAREENSPEHWRAHPRSRFEFYKDGSWVKDENRSLHLSDAMMDYGEYSPSDYDDLTEEQAQQLMTEIDKRRGAEHADK